MTSTMSIRHILPQRCRNEHESRWVQMMTVIQQGRREGYQTATMLVLMSDRLNGSSQTPILNQHYRRVHRQFNTIHKTLKSLYGTPVMQRKTCPECRVFLVLSLFRVIHILNQAHRSSQTTLGRSYSYVHPGHLKTSTNQARPTTPMPCSMNLLLVPP